MIMSLALIGQCSGAAGARGGWYADRGFTKSYKVGPDDHPAKSLSSETKCNATGFLLTLRFRDYPKLPKFARHRTALALMSPPALQPNSG